MFGIFSTLCSWSIASGWSTWLATGRLLWSNGWSAWMATWLATGRLLWPTACPAWLARGRLWMKRQSLVLKHSSPDNWRGSIQIEEGQSNQIKLERVNKIKSIWRGSIKAFWFWNLSGCLRDAAPRLNRLTFQLAWEDWIGLVGKSMFPWLLWENTNKHKHVNMCTILNLSELLSTFACILLLCTRVFRSHFYSCNLGVPFLKK